MTIAAVNEFALLPETAAAVGIPPHTTPTVRRSWVDVPGGGRISGVVWTSRPARAILLHRPGRDARALDHLALRLGWPIVVIDLPEQGHSEAVRPDELAYAIRSLAPEASAIVGFGSSALTALDTSTPRIGTVVLVDALPDPDATVWDRLTTTASSWLIRSRNSPVSPADVTQLRRRSPNTRLLQLAAPARRVESSSVLAAALQAVLTGAARERSRRHLGIV